MARLDVAVAVVKNEKGQILISQRKLDAHQGGLWEFPGGKFEKNETAHQALVRELKEELNITAVTSIPLINISFDYPTVNVRLHVRVVECFTGSVKSLEGQLYKWVDESQLTDYLFPEANQGILKAIGLTRHYPIINSSDIKEVLIRVDSLAEQGISLLQIRAKELLEGDVEQFFSQLEERCAQLGLDYLINSAVIRGDQYKGGVHLTSYDLMNVNSRPECKGYVAASCHNLKELQHAEVIGVDFVVLSPIKETKSHPGAELLGWERFEQLVAQVNIPVFALGGLGESDLDQSLAAGSQGLSGISLYN